MGKNKVDASNGYGGRCHGGPEQKKTRRNPMVSSWNLKPKCQFIVFKIDRQTDTDSYTQRCSSGNVCIHIYIYIYIYMQTYSQSSHIYWFRISEFTYSLKFICNAELNTCSVFLVIPGHLQSDIHFPSWGPRRECSAFSFQLSYCQCVLIVVYLVPCFSHFLWLLGDVTVENGPKCSKCCLVFLSTGMLQCALWGKCIR